MVTLNMYCKTEYKNFDLQMLQDTSTGIVMNITEDDAKFVEAITREQHKNWIWEKLRVGRVTGSIFKSVCRGRLKTPSKTLLMKMCYPELSKFVSAATEYGKREEDEARQTFVKEMQSIHKNFSCTAVGLVIDYRNPFFAVSPDGICKCDCCGEVMLETKCPYTLCKRKSTYEDLLKITDPYIARNNNEYNVVTTHSYYYQMQLQMAICGINRCYFYVWSKHMKPLTLEVLVDFNFMNENLPKAEKYVKQVIVPELMNCCYTKTY